MNDFLLDTHTFIWLSDRVSWYENSDRGDVFSSRIPEYWIVDYLGYGGSRYIGFPKQPTISVYQLFEGEYRVRQFRESVRFESPTFTELNLTAFQIFRGER